MAPTTSFLFSTLFKVIGPGKSTFKVHGELLAQKSKVLAKDVNGMMRETETETIEIEAVDGDIDDDTVMRFLEYIYTGDYPVPDPVILQLSSDPKGVTEVFCSKEATEVFCSDESVQTEPFEGLPLVDPPSPVTSHPGSGVKGRGRGRGHKKLGSQGNTLHSVPAPTIGVARTCTPRRYMTKPQPSSFSSSSEVATRGKLWHKFCNSVNLEEPQIWIPPTDNDQREDFSLMFLCHARIYKFSDRYDCPDLMDLSLQRLRWTLVRYIFHQERASDIVELVRYTYLHTMEFEEGHDKLRLLVLDYVVCYIHQLSKEESFLALIKESGSLASDLLVKMVGLFE